MKIINRSRKLQVKGLGTVLGPCRPARSDRAKDAEFAIPHGTDPSDLYPDDETTAGQEKDGGFTSY